MAPIGKGYYNRYRREEKFV
ncbi:hypothetical protein Goklo_028469, partial [Gossypium klotzschianum]|nr:hypothetical protein [Gossypium klotzschianum]